MGVNLRGDRVVLRAVELRDVEFMYGVENDLDSWGVSGTTLPFSQYILERFVESQREDIFSNRELRLMVTTLSGELVGMVDLFEFDPLNRRVGVGVFIIEPCRRCGFAVDALRVVHRYAEEILQMHQIWCNVEAGNLPSLELFSKLGYSEIGRKSDWICRNSRYCDEIMLQYIFSSRNL